jgi:small subunit ribosomal protein S9
MMLENKEVTDVIALPKSAEPVATPEKAAKPKRKVQPRKTVKKGERIIVVKSKRKRAIARASIRSGNGTIKINRINLNIIEPKELRMFIMDPLNVSEITKNTARSADIDINVKGGGIMAQAQAARGAIAKALSGFSNSDVIKKEYLRYDRTLLADDPRRVEPKKYLGTKARARFQTSYR